MSKNGNNSNNSKKVQDDKLEHPKEAVIRLIKDILNESRLISTGQKESCFTLVEKTKELMANEEKLDLDEDYELSLVDDEQ